MVVIHEEKELIQLNKDEVVIFILTRVRTLPSLKKMTNLKVLTACANLLHTLPDFPENLRVAFLDHNCLTSIPTISCKIQNLTIARNYSLKAVPEAVQCIEHDVSKINQPKWLNYENLVRRDN